jgi:hypothetical protein
MDRALLATGRPADRAMVWNRWTGCRRRSAPHAYFNRSSFPLRFTMFL